MVNMTQTSREYNSIPCATDRAGAAVMVSEKVISQAIREPQEALPISQWVTQATEGVYHAPENRLNRTWSQLFHAPSPYHAPPLPPMCSVREPLCEVCSQ